MDEIENTDADIDYEQYKLQVAGHVFGRGVENVQLGVLRQKSTGHLLKPMQRVPRGEREANFYNEVFVLRQMDGSEPRVTDDPVMSPLAKLIPVYYGTRVIPFDGVGHCYIEMEDISAKFRQPCILDVKIGSVTWDPDAAASKIHYEQTKYPWGLKLGFRFLGMRVHDSVTNDTKIFDKHWGKRIKDSDILSTLHQYFGQQEKLYVRQILDKVLEQLRRIQHWFEHQRKYKFYSSSVLLVYEGSPGADTEEWICDAKMIDFTHIFPTIEQDNNYVEGMINFIKHLEKYRRHYLN